MGKLFLNLLQISIAFTLIILVLLQGGGAGITGSFSGGESFRTRRGIEKILLYLTAIVAVAFVVTTIINLLIS